MAAIKISHQCYDGLDFSAEKCMKMTNKSVHV